MFPPLSEAWSLRIVRKLTRGAPCFTGLIGGYCSHWLRRLFRPHWAYFALLRSSIRNSRLATLPLASLLCSLDFRFACFAHCARRSSVPQGARFVRPRHCHPPQFAIVALQRCRLQSSFAHWAYYGLFRALRAAFVRPLQFPLKSYGFSGAETAKKRFLLWKMGFSGAAYCESMHPSIQHGRTTALAGSLAALPASLGLLRAVSPTGRALRAPPPYTPPGTIKARKGFGSTIRHGRSASSHHATFSGPVFRGRARRSFSSPFQKTPAHGFTNATICGIL